MAAQPAARPSPQTLRLRNLAVAAGLLGFVAGVYAYTIRAVGDDELDKAITDFERQKGAAKAEGPAPSKGGA